MRQHMQQPAPAQADKAPGRRLRHFGDFKKFLGSTQPFDGASLPFAVGQPAEGTGLWGGLMARLRSWMGASRKLLA